MKGIQCKATAKACKFCKPGMLSRRRALLHDFANQPRKHGTQNYQLQRYNTLPQGREGKPIYVQIGLAKKGEIR